MCIIRKDSGKSTSVINADLVALLDRRACQNLYELDELLLVIPVFLVGDRVGFLGIASGLNCMMLGVEW